MLASSQQGTYAGLALLCAMLAGITDVRTRRIPNALTGSAILAGMLLHLALDGWSGVAASILGGLLAGVLFALLYLAGGMGAGDVKLITAVGCLNGLAHLEIVLLATVLSGGLCALGLAVYRGRLRQTLHNVAALMAHHGRLGIKPHPSLNLANQQTLRIPYAVPVAAGCLAAVWAALSGRLL